MITPFTEGIHMGYYVVKNCQKVDQRDLAHGIQIGTEQLKVSAGNGHILF